MLRDLEVVFIVHHLRVERGVFAKDLGNRGVFEDRFPRALRFACATVDAFLRMNVKLIGVFATVVSGVLVDTLDGTYVNTSLVYTVTAHPCDYPCHVRTPRCLTSISLGASVLTYFQLALKE